MRRGQAGLAPAAMRMGSECGAAVTVWAAWNSYLDDLVAQNLGRRHTSAMMASGSSADAEGALRFESSTCVGLTSSLVFRRGLASIEHRECGAPPRSSILILSSRNRR
jgi:hypothetical protein